MTRSKTVNMDDSKSMPEHLRLLSAALTTVKLLMIPRIIG